MVEKWYNILLNIFSPLTGNEIIILILGTYAVLKIIRFIWKFMERKLKK